MWHLICHCFFLISPSGALESMHIAIVAFSEYLDLYFFSDRKMF